MRDLRAGSTRYAVLCAIARDGDRSLAEIGQEVGKSPTTIGYHVYHLRCDGWVTTHSSQRAMQVVRAPSAPLRRTPSTKTNEERADA